MVALEKPYSQGPIGERSSLNEMLSNSQIVSDVSTQSYGHPDILLAGGVKVLKNKVVCSRNGLEVLDE